MDLRNTTSADSPNGSPPPLSFTNGAPKHHPHPPPPPPPPPFIIYKECLKNHAATLGGHALDGCGEFMPSPTTTPNDPTSLKCAACGCHRNFHRCEPDETTHFLEFRKRKSPSSSPPLLQPNYTYPPHTLVALRTSIPDDRAIMTPVTPTAPKTENSGRKRFRTKFSHEQKEKMLSFAEKLGWKMQKCDESLVDNFCNEIGVGKSVLRVWLHNNKSTLGKINNKFVTNTGAITFDNNPHIMNNTNNSQPQILTGGGHVHVSTNGSSSSS